MSSPKFTSVLHAYQALCALLAGEREFAFISAKHALQQAHDITNERDIIRAEWILGRVLLCLSLLPNTGAAVNLDEAENYLNEALKDCRQMNMVDYEADLLLARGQLFYAKGDSIREATASVEEALKIASQSGFRVLRADIHNFLAYVALKKGDDVEASAYARKAFDDASCDAFPYCYKPALEEATRLLHSAQQHTRLLS